MKRPIVFVLAAFGIGMSLAAQDAETSQQSESGSSTDNWNLVLQNVTPTATGAAWLRLQAFPFVSDDGQYAAQNSDEVRTYEDLAMTYQYIEQPWLRKQLQLPEGQGVFVLDSGASGEGFANGFREGDLILKVDDQPVDTQYDFVIAVTDNREQEHRAEIRRDGQPLELLLTLSAAGQAEGRWIIGISVDELTDLVKAQLAIESGVSVSGVTDGSPAQQAGLQLHDVIVALNGTAINSLDDLKSIVQEARDQSIQVDFVRGGKHLSLHVTPTMESAAGETGMHLELQPHLLPVPLLHWHVQRNAQLQLHPQTNLHVQPVTDQQIMEKLAELEAKIDRLVESIR